MRISVGSWMIEIILRIYLVKESGLLSKVPPKLGGNDGMLSMEIK
jgi:hypothetical protein